MHPVAPNALVPIVVDTGHAHRRVYCPFELRSVAPYDPICAHSSLIRLRLLDQSSPLLVAPHVAFTNSAQSSPCLIMPHAAVAFSSQSNLRLVTPCTPVRRHAQSRQ